MSLTDKQKLFANEYIIDLNATRAYQTVYGCSYQTASVEGCKSLRKPKIKKYIENIMESKQSELIASQNEILIYLTDIMRGKASSNEIVIEAIGNGETQARVIERTPTQGERLKACELLGKRYGLFANKSIEIEQNNELVIKVLRASDVAEQKKLPEVL